MKNLFRAAALSVCLLLASLAPLPALAQGVTVQQLPPYTGGALPSGQTYFWGGVGNPGHTYALTIDQINAYVTSLLQTWSQRQIFAPSTSGAASINIPPGVAPISPQTGDFWCTSSSCFLRSPTGTTVNFGQTLTSTGSITTGHLSCWASTVTLNDCGAAPTIPTAANPTASIGATAVNGSATTYMRSDAAPKIGSNAVTNALLATMTANTLKGNNTGSTATPTDVSVPSCSTTGLALNWTAGTGFGCPGPFGVLANPEAWGGSQRVTLQTVTISTATFTPNFDTGGDFSITLSAACPCTLANPSTTPVAGQHGVIYVTQDGTGSRTFGTYGSSWIAPGGTSTIVLSTGANAVDVMSYAVKDSTHIVLSLGASNVSH